MSQNAEKSFICPIDTRRFKTAQAMQQHRLICHPGNALRGRGNGRGGFRVRGRGQRGGRGFSRGFNRGIGPRAGMWTRQFTTGTQGEQRIISGSDILTVFTIAATAKSGALLGEIHINPIHFTGTRLASEANLWNRWRPERLVINVVSAAGAMTSGQYVVGWTSDANEIVNPGITAITRTSIMRPSVTSHIAAGSTLSIPCNTMQRWYSLEGKDDNDTTHGKIVIVLSSAIGNLTSTSEINLTVRLNWRVKFYGPNLPGRVVDEAIYADDDYAPYFTTSTSDWASGNKLVLKARSGGGLVPFQKAKPQVVYKIDDSAKLICKTKDKDVSVKFGVLIPNFGVKSFALFEVKDKAVKFAATGDSTHCLDYYTASDYCTPSNPAWYETDSQVSFSLEEENLKLKQQIEELQKKLDKAILTDDKVFQ